jgi:site-specific DNA-cytosine methylase
MRVAGGFRRAMELCEVPFTTVNAFEKDPRFASFYRALKLTHVRVGDAGDVRSIQPEMLEDCEGLVCGAPCTPWAGSGKRLGVLDERAELFDIVVTWIIELAHRGCLLFFACENSPNVLQAEGKGTRAPYLQRVMALLHVAIPFFDIEVQVVDLYPMLPQTRTRAWLRGIRKDVSLGHPMPAVLKLLPEVTLEQILDPSLPNRSLECISLKAKRNLIAYMSKVQEDTVTGKAGNIAVVETHRAFGAKYGAVILYDRVPPLRASGCEYFLISVRDVSEPLEQRRFFRPLADIERLRLQGFPTEYAQELTSSMVKHGTGNAFAVPQVAAVALPLLKQVALSGVMQELGSHPLGRDDLHNLISDSMHASMSREEVSMRVDAMSDSATMDTPPMAVDYC